MQKQWSTQALEGFTQTFTTGAMPLDPSGVFHPYVLKLLVLAMPQYRSGCCLSYLIRIHTHTHTHPFNGHFSGTTQVSRYQRGKTNLDFTEARDSEWQWHQVEHMQVCTSLQTNNHASTSPLSFFYRPDALPAAQPTASKH